MSSIPRSKADWANSTGQASRKERTPSACTLMDTLIAAGGVLLVVTVGIIANHRCIHWFIAPVAASGVITGRHVVAWLRGRLDTFDPLAIIAILWFNSTCLAPILHVAWDASAPMFGHVPDARFWFGYMGGLNLLGLAVFHLAERSSCRITQATSSFRHIHPGTFNSALVFALIVSGASAGVIFGKYGGLRQDLEIATTTHLSWLMMLGDPFALLMLVGIVRMLSGRRRALLLVTALLMSLLLCESLLLGLRGSRSAMIAPMIIGGALCHYHLRRIPVVYVLIGALLLGVGGYYYKFYKRFGVAGFAAVQDPTYRAMLSHRGGISPTSVLLGDLSRAEVQAYLLYRFSDRGSDYQLRLGKTYLASALSVIPRAVWPNKPTDQFGKVRAGTELQFGTNAYRPVRFESSLVYGLAGEALLNFGPVGVPFAYLLFGLGIGWYRRKLGSLLPFDARLYLAPVMTIGAFTAAFGDSDNTAFAVLKNGLLLLAVVYLGSRRAGHSGLFDSREQRRVQAGGRAGRSLSRY